MDFIIRISGYIFIVLAAILTFKDISKGELKYRKLIWALCVVSFILSIRINRV